MFKKAIIAIGGKGTRLRDLTKNSPKPLYPIDGKSTLLRSIEQLKNFNINEIILTTYYKYNQFKDHINFIRKSLDIKLEVYQEPYPLGECGALWEIKDMLNDDFLFINGDLIFSMDFKRFFDFHKDLNSKLTLVTHPSSHPDDSDLISSPNGSLVKSIFYKNDYRKPLSGYLGNAGIAALSPCLMREFTRPTNLQESSLFSYIVRNAIRKKIRVFSYNTSEYIKDIGTPERFFSTEKDIKSGLVDKKNYSNKQKVLFIDRDNTLINCQKNQYITSYKDVKIIKNNVIKISDLSKDYLATIVITNQPQISMNLLNFQELDKIHTKIFLECNKYNLFIDDFIFCPHHPHAGFKNELSALKINCFCRKPNPGMIFEQAFKRNIYLEKSLFIGDSIADEEAARRANVNFKYI